MTSQRSYTELHSKEESMRFWVNPNTSSSLTSDDKSVILEISEESKSILSQQSIGAEKVSCSEEEDNSLSDKDKLKIRLIEDFFKYCLGKKIKIIVPSMKKLKDLNTNQSSEGLSRANQRAGWGFEFRRNETHYESEKVSFSAEGKILTKDGREINISLQVSVSREFLQQSSLSIRAGDAVLKDPLVINYEGNSFNLSDTKFSFDIDSDGQSEQISFAGAGSGFLSLDLNNDGVINDGSELFGTDSGDGFSDLSAYDDDKNGWIDENDEVFDKLRIWTKDSNGNDSLFALGEKGIGAVYLGNVSTVFSLKSEGNLNGVARKTGIFLREDGSAGTIQHIDVAI